MLRDCHLTKLNFLKENFGNLLSPVSLLGSLCFNISKMFSFLKYGYQSWREALSKYAHRCEVLHFYLIFYFTNMQKSIVKKYWSNKMINVGIADPFYYKVAQRAESCYYNDPQVFLWIAAFQDGFHLRRVFASFFPPFLMWKCIL